MGIVVDWTSEESHSFLNPRMPEAEKQRLASMINAVQLPSRHIFIATSGTTGKPKWVALSKEAFLVSAHAVNEHIQANSSDRWLNCLPIFHVGGLSIFARAFLCSRDVHDISDRRWDVDFFVQNAQNATVTSLVPAQLFDIVVGGYRCPKSLRAVFLGGGRLNDELYAKGRELGWPILPTFGMTECSSQIATALLGEPGMVPLKHVKIRSNDQGCMEIASASLLSGYITEEGWVDPKKVGWFTTEDHVKMQEGKIIGVSRNSDFAKIGGESVDMQRLQAIVEDVRVSLSCRYGATVVAVEDERLGQCIELHLEGRDEHLSAQLAEAYNKRVMPFERVRGVVFVKSVSRTLLGKVSVNRRAAEKTKFLQDRQDGQDKR